MNAELAHDVFGIDQDIEQVRHRRALIAADIGDAGLQQRLGDGKDAFAVEGVAVAQLQRLHFLLERAFHNVSPMVGVPTILLPFRYICEGSQIARIGKAMRMASRQISVKTKGMTP